MWKIIVPCNFSGNQEREIMELGLGDKHSKNITSMYTATHLIYEL